MKHVIIILILMCFYSEMKVFAKDERLYISTKEVPSWVFDKSSSGLNPLPIKKYSVYTHHEEGGWNGVYIFKTLSNNNLDYKIGKVIKDKINVSCFDSKYNYKKSFKSYEQGFLEPDPYPVLAVKESHPEEDWFWACLEINFFDIKRLSQFRTNKTEIKKTEIFKKNEKELLEKKAIVIDSFKFKDKEIQIFLKKIDNAGVDEKQNHTRSFEDIYITYSSIPEMGIIDIDRGLSSSEHSDQTILAYAGDFNDDGFFDLAIINQEWWIFTFILSDKKGKYTQYVGSPQS